MSEWQRSADEEAAPSATKMPGTATGEIVAPTVAIIDFAHFAVRPFLCFINLIGKAKALKIIGVILQQLLRFISFIVFMVNYATATAVFSFLFSVALMVGVLIYNPGKKAN